MRRTARSKAPEPVLQFGGISEQQWHFLRFRSWEESDAAAAQAAGVSARVAEGWKKRSAVFQAMHSFAVAQPRLFARGELYWRHMFAEPRRERNEAVDADGFARVGALYSPEQPDVAFEQAVRRRELAAQPASFPAPAVDLAVPEEFKRVNDPPREMLDGERALAEALGVEHAVVSGYWNGKPSLGSRPHHEGAVDVVAQHTPGFRMEHWYPYAVLFSSAGLIAVADGALSKVAGCPVKRTGRCPYIGNRVHLGGSCSHWDLALGSWLDREPPGERERSPICDRDFTISRLLAYLSTATMRSYGHNGGWYAGFPVITVETVAERAYWAPRIAHWNKLILDPWHRVRMIERDTILNAIVDFRVTERLANHSSWTEDRR